MTKLQNKDERISNGTRFFVFGNPDVAIDSLPVKLLPKLRERFPEIAFEVLDPNEEWDVPKHMVIIDTVVGIEKITTFDNLEVFTNAPKVTCHDFDAYTNLQFLKKLGKIESVFIIGVPPDTENETLISELNKAVITVIS